MVALQRFNGKINRSLNGESVGHVLVPHIENNLLPTHNVFLYRRQSVGYLTVPRVASIRDLFEKVSMRKR